jgi:hypothetical protein
LRGSVVLLAILCVLAAQVVAASVLLAFPSTPPPALTPGEVAGALLTPGGSVTAGLRLSVRATAPFAPIDRPYTRLVARTLQSLLARAGIREVRVHSLSDAVALTPPRVVFLEKCQSRLWSHVDRA